MKKQNGMKSRRTKKKMKEEEGDDDDGSDGQYEGEFMLCVCFFASVVHSASPHVLMSAIVERRGCIRFNATLIPRLSSSDVHHVQHPVFQYNYCDLSERVRKSGKREGKKKTTWRSVAGSKNKKGENVKNINGGRNLKTVHKCVLCIIRILLVSLSPSSSMTAMRER